MLGERWVEPVLQGLTRGDKLGEALTETEKDAASDAEGDLLPLDECELLLQSVANGEEESEYVEVALATSERRGERLKDPEGVCTSDAEAHAVTVKLPPLPLVGLEVAEPKPLKVALGEKQLLDEAVCTGESDAHELALCVGVTLLLKVALKEGVAEAHIVGGEVALRRPLAVAILRLAVAEGEEEGVSDHLCVLDEVKLRKADCELLTVPHAEIEADGRGVELTIALLQALALVQLEAEKVNIWEGETAGVCETDGESVTLALSLGEAVDKAVSVDDVQSLKVGLLLAVSLAQNLGVAVAEKLGDGVGAREGVEESVEQLLGERELVLQAVNGADTEKVTEAEPLGVQSGDWERMGVVVMLRVGDAVPRGEAVALERPPPRPPLVTL
jgi:hypothetical protein